MIAMSEASQDKENNNKWKYSPVDGPVDSLVETSETAGSDPSVDTSRSKTGTSEPLVWAALDSMTSSKTPAWYLVLAILTLAFSSGVYLFTKDKITTAVVIVSGILIGVYAAKKPKMVDYQIDGHGFKVGQRNYIFGNFKSFSIVRQGENLVAVLVPLRRFMPYMYINFTIADEEKITDTLAKTLPIESNRRDYIEGFLRRIGF